jgi:hypothetical protein
MKQRQMSDAKWPGNPKIKVCNLAYNY